MGHKWLWVLAMAGAMACGCGSAGLGTVVKSDKPRATAVSVPAVDVDKLVSGNSEFAWGLYQQLRGQEGNLFFSPYSISAALAMTHAGARGETEKQMAKALSFQLPQDTLHPAFNALGLALASRGKGAAGREGQPFRLHIANALWGQEGFAFLPDFLDVLAVNYGARMRLVDYQKQTEAARKTINGWVSKETEDKIKDLIAPGVLNTLTRLVLTNAIYFDAAWQDKFEKRATEPMPFTLLDGREVNVDMMHGKQRQGRYAEGEGWIAAEVPYQGGELAMAFLVPTEFAEFEAGLDANRARDMLNQLREVEYTLYMPKFKYESSFSLKDGLAAMGMTDAFDAGRADLSGMDGKRDLFISAVLHKALLRVDEEGTEAAAATAVVIAQTAAPPGEPLVVTIDRPFIFLIRDVRTGTVLFIGRVMDPRG